MPDLVIFRPNLHLHPSWWLPSALTFLLCCTMTAANSQGHRAALHHTLTTTTGEALYELWHTDCHRKCRAQLVDHVSLACHFDPYKMRGRRSTLQHNNRSSPDSLRIPLFLPRRQSASFLRQGVGLPPTPGPSRRLHKRGIMEECCYGKACSWEEYAEFCHGYNRRSNLRGPACF